MVSWAPTSVVETDFSAIENFVCTACRYKCKDVNKLRFLIFSKSYENNLRKLPPTKDALKLHVLRSAYVAGWIWGTALNFEVARPSPFMWGWKCDEKINFIPDWCSSSENTLNDILYPCNCQNKCTRCKCIKKNERCLPFCKCKCYIDDK